MREEEPSKMKTDAVVHRFLVCGLWQIRTVDLFRVKEAL